MVWLQKIYDCGIPLVLLRVEPHFKRLSGAQDDGLPIVQPAKVFVRVGRNDREGVQRFGLACFDVSYHYN